MFDQFNKPTTPVAADSSNLPKPAEDIFDNIDSGAFNPLTTPKPEAFNAIMSQVEAPQDLSLESDTDSVGKNKKYLFVLLSIIGGLVIIAGGTLLVLAKMKVNIPVKTAVDTSEIQPVVEKKTADKVEEKATDAQLADSVTGSSSEASRPAVAPIIDSDQDGLIDSEEIRLGTNPNQKDSDDDGLGDMDEVKIYATDPLNPDTDGDTYKDGEEVSKGFNPHGKGRLFDVTGQQPKISDQ